MDFFTQWLFLASIQAAAVIWPGPAFALTVRQALAHGRQTGVMTAFGLGAGVTVHAVLAVVGVSALVAQSQWLYLLIKYAGAAYLFYLGALAIIKAKPASLRISDPDDLPAPGLPSLGKAFQIGAITNLLNPKAIVFYVAIYAQFITPHTPWQIAALYSFTAFGLEFIWFSIVATILTNPAIKKTFLNFAHWIERTCGTVLIALSLKMVLSK